MPTSNQGWHAIWTNHWFPLAAGKAFSFDLRRTRNPVARPPECCREYGNTNRELKDPNPEAYLSSTGLVGFYRCKDDSLVPVDFIPGDPVPDLLRAASMFRRFLNLKQQNKPKELESFLTSYDAKLFTQLNQSKVDFASNSKGKVQLRLTPSSLLSALWYQLGLKLSGDTNVRTCRLCNAIFETGVGTGRRLDAEFCSNKHKVEFFNRNRRGKIDRTSRAKP
jgi:hypothetical protein